MAQSRTKTQKTREQKSVELVTEAEKQEIQASEMVQAEEREINTAKTAEPVSKEPTFEETEVKKQKAEEVEKDIEERGARRARLLALRKRLGFTQTEVARAAGLGLSTYYELENKHSTRKFSEEVFKQVAKVLDTTPQYILFGTREEKQAPWAGRADKSMPSNEGGAVSSVRLKALITSILEIEDAGAFGKIEEYVRDQKEFMALKQRSAAG